MYFIIYITTKQKIRSKKMYKIYVKYIFYNDIGIKKV